MAHQKFDPLPLLTTVVQYCMPISAYRKANLAKVRETNKQWRLNNPDKMAEYAKRHREKNRPARRAAKKEWRKIRPDETPIQHQQRTFNARKHTAGRAALSVADLQWPTHCPVFGWELDYTGLDLQRGWSIDKFRPELGYVPGNVVIISRLANQIKSSATPEQVAQVAQWMANQ